MQMGAGEQVKEMGKGEQVFLIAHTDGQGKNVAQATVLAPNELTAKSRFRQEFPERSILTVGVRGVS
jgi:hypothetical protein